MTWLAILPDRCGYSLGSLVSKGWVALEARKKVNPCCPFLIPTVTHGEVTPVLCTRLGLLICLSTFLWDRSGDSDEL